jgi:hypothetical protein
MVVVVAVVMRVDARLHPHDVLRTEPTGNIVRFVLGHGKEPLCITAGSRRDQFAIIEFRAGH